MIQGDCKAPGCDRPGALRFRVSGEPSIDHCGPHTAWAIDEARRLTPKCRDCRGSGTVRRLGRHGDHDVVACGCDPDRRW